MFNSYKINTLQYYPKKCINCLMCTQVCPHGVFTEESTEKGHVKLAEPSACMECGACTGNCPVQAIEVQSGVGCAWAMIGAALKGKDIDSDAVCCGEEGCCQ